MSTYELSLVDNVRKSLEKRGADVLRVLRGQNKDTSAGDFSEGKRRWVVRTLGQFRDPGEVRNQLLVVQNGAPIYVRDVAEVKLGFKKATGVVRRLGESSISLNCIRESGANVLEVMAGLREANREINERILLPGSVPPTKPSSPRRRLAKATRTSWGGVHQATFPKGLCIQNL